MADVTVQVENVSKKFSRNLGAAMRYGMRDVLKDFAGRPPKPEPLRPHEFWSAKDVSFTVNRGECLAMLGPNGAGKSTTLKMLNGIYLPDKGRIEMHGRVGALIELGAGFSPMLSGRENIYINGAILGLSREEIDERFDAIVEFAEIGDFLDTAVKFYSSGMYVRLGFSIAAQMRPDVLLIDEILAVGDVGFRMKCFKHLNRLVDEGTSIIIVSHSPQALIRVTDRALVFAEGSICFDGQLQEGIGVYHNLLHVDVKNMGAGGQKRPESGSNGHHKGAAIVESVLTVDAEGRKKDKFHTGDDVLVDIRIRAKEGIEGARLVAGIETPSIGKFASISTPYTKFVFDVTPPQTTIRLCLDRIPLLVGGYTFNISLYGPDTEDFYDRALGVGSFAITGPKIDTNGYGVSEAINLPPHWEKTS